MMLVKASTPPLLPLKPKTHTFASDILPLLTPNQAQCKSKSLARFSSKSQETLNPVSWSKKWELHVALPEQIVETLQDEDRQVWEECRTQLSALGFDNDQGNLILSKAFGWFHSPYWGEEREKEIPQSEKMKEILDYLKRLGLTDTDLFQLLKKFPEVLGCKINEEIKSNVGTLEKEWGIKGNSLRNLLLRNPKVLGYNVDCKGDCMAQCTRCWVRF